MTAGPARVVVRLPRELAAQTVVEIDAMPRPPVTLKRLRAYLQEVAPPDVSELVAATARGG
jgi:hypothetical protein